MGKPWKQWQTLFSCPKLLQMVTEALKSGEIWCWRGLLRVSWTARKSNQDWCWGWNFNTLATWCEELTHWKRPWIWERLKVGGEGDNRKWDAGMPLPARWTWVWAGSGSWLWTGKPGLLQSMGSQSQTQLSNWTELYMYMYNSITMLYSRNYCILNQLYFN